MVVDKKDCIIVELKDNTKDHSYNAAGLSTYSNSRSIVSSYAAIFETLWRQTELSERLKEANEQLVFLNKRLEVANAQLKVNDKMQKEFINVAAHELRAPIHPLLLSSESLKHSMPNEERISIIAKNAKGYRHYLMPY